MKKRSGASDAGALRSRSYATRNQRGLDLEMGKKVSLAFIAGFRDRNIFFNKQLAYLFPLA